jgi:glycosyltransferase involved in cell wall biosynthesis
MQTFHKIKIVYAICSLRIGGAERMLVDLVNGLDRARFEPSIICLKEGGALADELSDVPIYVVGKRTKLGVDAIFSVFRLLKTIRPDILHTHLFCGDFWCRLAGIFAKVPMIFSTEHNLHTVDSWFERFVKWILNLWTKRIIFVSTAVKVHYQGRVPLSERKAVIIPNGIVTARFFRERQILQEETVRFITIARLTAQKGHVYFLQALARHKEKPWRYTIVGSGGEEFRLRGLASHFWVENRVEFTGERRNVAEILKRSDVFVLPSLYEGQGICLLEAAVSGCLIIASKVDGIAETFNDREVLFSDPGDVDSLSMSLEWLFSHRSEAQTMAKRAQTLVGEKYDIPRMVAAYEKVYENSSNK